MKTLNQLRYSEYQLHKLYVVMLGWKNKIKENAKYSGAVATAKNLEYVNMLNDKIAGAEYNGSSVYTIELSLDEIKYISNALETWNCEIKHQFNMGLLDFDKYEHNQQMAYQLLSKVDSILL